MLVKRNKSILILSIILGIFLLGLVSSCESYCGDGNVDYGEECDDGNDDDFDLCSNDCQIQYCDFELIKTDSADPVSPGDDLSYDITLTNIGTAKCTGGGVQVKEYYDEYTSFVESVPAPISGNNLWNFGTIMPGVTKEINIDTEVSESTPCDETLVNEVCVWALEIDEWRCIEETTEIYCEPPEPVCGDGVLEGNEICDEGIDNGDICVPEYESSCQYCDNTCELVVLEGPYCGDGYCLEDETCETCPQDCGECPPEPPECGDGVLDSGEECDDGNNINGDGCSSICEIEIPEPFCGDGNLDSGEECDDGNNINGDGCSSICEIEIPEPFCGDGNLDSGEECDDGNNVNGDGCSSICLIEEEDNDGNGRGGGGTPTLLKFFCDPNWECSSWSECSGGIRTRTCQDTNHCEDPYNKPIEQTGCVEGIISKSLVDENGFNWGFVLFGIITPLILIIILIIIASRKKK